MSFIYIQTEPNVYTVGHYSPDGTFIAESDHDTPQAAADRIHWLNGGE